MSLIEEALRGVKEPLLTQTSSPPQPSSRQSPASSSPTTAHAWPVTPTTTISSAPPPGALPTSSTSAWLAVAMAVLVLTVAFVVGGALWIRQTLGRPIVEAPSQDAQPAEPTRGEPRRATQAPTPSRSAVSVAQARQSSAVSANLALSGVVEGVGEPYAVINGLIVGIGERVAGFELTAIANGSVTLRRSDGQELTLRVPR